MHQLTNIMTKIITSQKHLNAVVRKDNYALESNKIERDRKWAIEWLNRLKNTIYTQHPTLF